MDFTLTERERSFQARVRAFMAEKVRPRVAAVHAEIAEGDRWAAPLPSIEALKVEARAAGLWNLFMPPAPEGMAEPDDFEFTGERLTNLEYALCAEEMGRIEWASEVFNCSAPDTGNMEVLHRYGSPAQKAQWLIPLMNGETRSAFQ